MSANFSAIIAVAAFALSLPVLHGQAPKSVWDGVYTSEQATRGELLYRDHCASCHGEMLQGGDMAPVLTGPEFGANWNGLTVGDLFERIRVSMPVGAPTRLTAQQKLDVLAHMLHVGKFPVGATELSRETAPQIAYQLTRP